jgi:hypothetical protein
MIWFAIFTNQGHQNMCLAINDFSEGFISKQRHNFISEFDFNSDFATEHSLFQSAGNPNPGLYGHDGEKDSTAGMPVNDFRLYYTFLHHKTVPRGFANLAFGAHSEAN